MAYSEQLLERIRDVVKGKRGIVEKKMFGGVAFLYHRNMFCGPTDDRLMVRVGKDAYEEVLKQKYVTEMNFTGRPLRGMVYVLPAGMKTKAQLATWIDKGLSFAKTLPKK